MTFEFLQSETFVIILPFLIFMSRIVDVSIGTMRLIFVSRGFKLFAAICGFFEVFIWLVAITQIMNNLTNIFNYIAYAGGFATGNYIGMMIEEKIALGTVLIRAVSQEPLDLFVDYLKDNGYGVTILDAQGGYGSVNIMFSILPRNKVPSVVAHLKELSPKIFYTIEDVRFVNAGVMSPKNPTTLFPKKNPTQRRTRRKGK